MSNILEFSNHRKDIPDEHRIVYISVGTMDAESLGAAVESLDIPVSVRLASANSETIDSSGLALAQIVEALDSADALLMRTHGDPKHMKRLGTVLERARSRGMLVFIYCDEDDVMREYRGECSLDDRDFALLRKYMGLGGDRNYRCAIAWICRRFSGLDFEVPEPVVPRAQGIYHPDLPDDPDEDEFLSGIPEDRPVVGILFRQHYWMSHNHAHIDALIRALEARGAFAVPVFCLSAPSDITESIGMPATIERYFKKDGKAAIDALIMSFRFSQLAAACPDGGSSDNFFASLDVPVLQAPFVLRSPEEWASSQGLTSNELATSVIWPEFDGQIIAPPLAFLSLNGEGRYAARFVQDRVDAIADAAVGWARLRRKDAKDRRIAILLNMHSGSVSMGGAAGLDTFESLRSLLSAMRDAGYALDRIPETPEELARSLMSGITNDLEQVPLKGFSDRAAGWMPPEAYRKAFCRVPAPCRERMVEEWGEPPGRFMTDRGGIAIPGMLDGNVLIGFQPTRGDPEEDPDLYMHSADMPAPHHYLAYYEWLRSGFGADAIVHFGTHGSLEWLPGKNSGLSSECWPEVVRGSIPIVYPYIVDDPGEGVGAKRRIGSLIVDYMAPPMTRAGAYGELEELDSRLQAYMYSRAVGRQDKMDAEAAEIDRLAEALELPRIEDGFQALYELVTDLKEAPIKNGLHILGRVPEGEELEEEVYALTRLRNGGVPSLRGALAASSGMDFDALKDDPSGTTGGRANGELIDEYDARSRELVHAAAEAGYDAGAVLEAWGLESPEAERALRYACEDLVPRIRMTSDEIGNILKGLSGRYVDKGPSGSPFRGNAHILPTGRNFYSLDPETIPSQASWEIGKRMAEEMLAKSLEALGHYPETVGIIIWATDTIKTGGDDIAYILFLLGLRPVWASADGRVSGLEAISLEELGRPRIDVTMRMTGMFRDSFPGIIELLDEAVRAVSELDEDEGSNLIRKHVREEVAEDIMKGLPEDKARLQASIRLFGDAPGSYGCGTGDAIGSSAWKDVGDLADVYARYGAFSYSNGMNGARASESFIRRMSRVEVTVKNTPDRGMDVLDVDDYYEILGGMNAAVRAYGGKKPLSLMGDSSDRDRTRVRTIEEETAFVMRSRVLNPKWADGMRKHGFRGAQEFSKLTGALLGWAATSDTVEPWEFEAVARRFIEDNESRDWIAENNPYALKSMVDDLLECVERGLWDAPEDILETLKHAYLEAEERIEDMTDR